jgi:aminoglycoside phosphotransferase (APT) family kinase protein
LLLMTRLRGSNLGDQLETTTSRGQNERAVRAAAAALASFHRFALDSDQRRSLQTELGNLRGRLDPVHNVAPQLATEVALLLAQVEALLAQLPPAAGCVIHGEYKPNQLLLSEGRIAVVDLDRACIGDPAIDVGNFMAVLRKEVLLEGHGHLEGLDAVFLAEYDLAHHVDGLARRAKLFESISFLRMLTRHFERAPQQYARRREDWPPLVLLRETRRSLASL